MSCHLLASVLAVDMLLAGRIGGAGRMASPAGSGVVVDGSSSSVALGSPQVRRICPRLWFRCGPRGGCVVRVGVGGVCCVSYR